MPCVVSPEVQWPAEPLKSETSRTAVPIPEQLALELSAVVSRHGSGTVLATDLGESVAPWAIERAMWSARRKVDGMPEGFWLHDLRHYFASLLIGSGGT